MDPRNPAYASQDPILFPVLDLDGTKESTQFQRDGDVTLYSEHKESKESPLSVSVRQTFFFFMDRTRG